MADEWRCPDCGARVQPRDVTRHHGECAAAADIPERLAETDEDERGDICMALRDLGFEDEADYLGGEPIENCRRHFEELADAPWNWEAQQDKWTVQAMRTAAALDPEFDPEHTYDPYGNDKHRYYEEN